MRILWDDVSIITRKHYIKNWFINRFKKKQLIPDDLNGLYQICSFSPTITEDLKRNYMKRLSNRKFKLKQLELLLQFITKIPRFDDKSLPPWLIGEKGERLFAFEDIQEDMYSALAFLNGQIMNHVSSYNNDQDLFIRFLYDMTFKIINVHEATIMRIYEFAWKSHIPFSKYAGTFKTMSTIPEEKHINSEVNGNIIKKRYEVDNFRTSIKNRSVQQIEWNKENKEIVNPRIEHILSFLDFLEYDKKVEDLQTDLDEVSKFISKLNLDDDIETYKENIAKDAIEPEFKEEKMEVEGNTYEIPENQFKTEIPYLQGKPMKIDHITKKEDILIAEEWKVEGKFDKETMQEESIPTEELKKWAATLKKVEESWIMKKEQRTLFSEITEKKYCKCVYCSAPIGLFQFKEYKFNIIWIEGFYHYVLKHGVKPTEEFYMFIKNYLSQ
jgi:hypothetical protein